MTTQRKNLWTIAFVIVSFFLTTCKKDIKICDSYTKLTDHNHLVDISVLNGAPELLDTLVKYQQLQVYRVFNDQYAYGMHCHVFYKGLKVFTDNYQLWKSKTYNNIYGDTSIVDTINISLTPSIKFDEAIIIAKQNINYNNTCISYRLGISDLNAGTSYQQKNYKLTWKIQGEDGYPVVVLDANNGQVYYAFDGIIID